MGLNIPSLISVSVTGLIHLSGGFSTNLGRVEVLYNGVWGNVCNISILEVQAVCNILAYKNSGAGILFLN